MNIVVSASPGFQGSRTTVQSAEQLKSVGVKGAQHLTKPCPRYTHVQKSFPYTAYIC